MILVRRVLALLVSVLLLLSTGVAASALPPVPHTCVQGDVSVTANGEVLSKGPLIANDGGFAHAGTGLTFTFQARTFTPSQNICVIQVADVRTWQVSVWPCDNYPAPKPSRTQSLSWSVTVPLDCSLSSSPGLLTASLTNNKGSATGNVMIYAGAPGFVLPDKQARGLFGPFALQSDPVNSLTGALVAAETDAAVSALGVPLTVTRTYNSNDQLPGSLGPGWRPSYSDRLALDAGGARYLASDGREIGFTSSGTGFVVERGAARFTLARSESGYVLTSFDQLRMRFSAAGDLLSILDRSGQGVVLERVAGRVATVTNGRRSLSYDYNELGLIASVRLSGPGVEPRTVRYEYADGRLTGATSPGGVRTPGYIGALRLPTGNYLLGQREYNPTTGTFLTPDQGGSPNPYAYTSGNPLKTTDLQGLSDIDGTLTDVSHLSGYASTAALAGAVICTLARPCAPAVPILLQVSATTGVISAGTAGVLDAQACVVKGNCSALAADVAVGVVASRFPAIGRVAARESVPEVSQVLMRSPKQLQAKFKHAADFGVQGNYNKTNAAKFSAAINQHINAPGTQAITGTYHGEAVTHFIDPATRLNVITRNGTFVSGWRLSPAQLTNVLQHGGLGGG
jgi:RHS repeat-associated protein